MKDKKDKAKEALVRADEAVKKAPAELKQKALEEYKKAQAYYQEVADEVERGTDAMIRRAENLKGEAKAKGEETLGISN